MTRSLLVLPLLFACSEYEVGDKKPSVGAGNDTGAPFTNGTGTTTTTGVFTWGSGTGGTSQGSGTGAATGGPGTGTGFGTGTGVGTGGATGTGTGFTGTTGWDECDWAVAVAGYLDALQTPYDGRVLFCHSSAGNNYVYVDASIDSCLTHIGHNFDIFPTSLCGD